MPRVFNISDLQGDIKDLWESYKDTLKIIEDKDLSRILKDLSPCTYPPVSSKIMTGSFKKSLQFVKDHKHGQEKILIDILDKNLMKFFNARFLEDL